MRRQLPVGAALVGLILGLGLGLLSGWVVWPAEYDSISPDLLSSADQIDYANMVAAAYTAEGNLRLAQMRLARLGPAAGTALAHAAETDPAAARLLVDLDAPPVAPAPTD